jgi:hypothetical protein
MQYVFEADQLEGDTTRGSVFTSMMVDGLETGKADLDADGYITVNEVYYYVSDQIRRRDDKQTPMIPQRQESQQN